jgi:hypothetical protein
MIQLEFLPQDEMQMLRNEMQKLRESNEKVRKSLYARHGLLEKNYFELSQRLSILESNICRQDAEELQRQSA